RAHSAAVHVEQHEVLALVGVARRDAAGPPVAPPPLRAVADQPVPAVVARLAHQLGDPAADPGTGGQVPVADRGGRPRVHERAGASGVRGPWLTGAARGGLPCEPGSARTSLGAITSPWRATSPARIGTMAMATLPSRAPSEELMKPSVCALHPVKSNVIWSPP